MTNVLFIVSFHQVAVKHLCVLSFFLPIVPSIDAINHVRLHQTSVLLTFPSACCSTRTGETEQRQRHGTTVKYQPCNLIKTASVLILML